MTLVDVEALIAGRIRSAPASQRVTWKDVMAIARELGAPCTRQWLNGNATIAAAYRDRRGLAAPDGTAGGGPEDVVTGLRRRIERLEQYLLAYDDRLVRYLYNARLEGIVLDKLERPIPVRLQE